jgi:hypothetical protein
MSAVQVQCPGCGGPVVFQVGAGVVAVCPNCRSAVARADRKVEDLGKVAALVETGAALKVGVEGRYNGQRFHLVGRTQLKHPAGGVWDEWYAAFPNDRWGWLAEAQGRYYLTFEKSVSEGLPDFDSLQIQQALTLPEVETSLTVSEKGSASVLGAEGTLPYRYAPGAEYDYADLTGKGGAFATLDYSDDAPVLYLGQQLTLDALGISERAGKDAWEQRQVAGKKLSCPKCAGKLDIRAPERTERVGCPYCGAMLEATEGDLRFLTMPAKLEQELQPLIPLGAVGKFGDDERTCIAMLRRSVTFDSIDYFWDEYLLYHPRDGFEWLVHSDTHWSRVRSVSPGEIEMTGFGMNYQDKPFKLFQLATGTVRAVLGECYWKVSVGEEARMSDCIAPPLILSRETSTYKDDKGKPSEEVNWSLGEYITIDEIKKAFDLPQDLPSPTGVAPNQPFRHRRVYLFGIALSVILCVLALLGARSREVYRTTFHLQPLPPGQKTQVFFSEDKFELRGWRNVCVTVDCPNLQGGLGVEGDLVHDADGKMQPFAAWMGYWTGVDGGEAWTEGSTREAMFVTAQSKGTYSLRLEVEPENPALPQTILVKVEQGVTRMKTFLFALALLVSAPIGTALYHMWFEQQRWKNSSLGSFADAAGDDDDDDE